MVGKTISPENWKRKNKREKNIPDRREQKILQMLRGRGLLGMFWISKEGECGQRKEPTLYCHEFTEVTATWLS
jgi:hypothetical protein